MRRVAESESTWEKVPWKTLCVGAQCSSACHQSPLLCCIISASGYAVASQPETSLSAFLFAKPPTVPSCPLPHVIDRSAHLRDCRFILGRHQSSPPFRKPHSIKSLTNPTSVHDLHLFSAVCFIPTFRLACVLRRSRSWIVDWKFPPLVNFPMHVLSSTTRLRAIFVDWRMRDCWHGRHNSCGGKSNSNSILMRIPREVLVERDAQLCPRDLG